MTLAQGLANFTAALANVFLFEALRTLLCRCEWFQFAAPVVAVEVPVVPVEVPVVPI